MRIVIPTFYIKAETIMRQLLTLLLLIPLLAGCGPVYRTVYDYVPPDDPAGKQCLNQCLQMYETCRSSAENRAAQERATCQQTAALTYAACLASAKTDLDRSRCSSSSYCNRQADFSYCMSNYRLCYQNCGGIVTSREECVEFCD